MTKCKAIIEFGDDYGDNTSTFHCQLDNGHYGLHIETGTMRGNMPYTLMWEGTIEYVNIKCPVCGYKMKVEKELWDSRQDEDGWKCFRHEEPEPRMVIDDEVVDEEVEE